MKNLRARPWLPVNLAPIVLCVFGLLNASNKPVAAVLFGLGLAASVSLGVIIELSYRRKLREQHR